MVEPEENPHPKQVESGILLDGHCRQNQQHAGKLVVTEECEIQPEQDRWIEHLMVKWVAARSRHSRKEEIDQAHEVLDRCR